MNQPKCSNKIPTAKDVYNNPNVRWCDVCSDKECPFSGKDHLVFCNNFKRVFQLVSRDRMHKEHFCNRGDCERKSYGAEPCTDCPFCDEKGNL